MARRFSTILEDCLQRLDLGESLADVLALYPEQADELKRLLLVAMASRAFPVPVPSQTALRLGRNQMLAEMNRLEIKQLFRKRSSIPLLSRGITGLVSKARTLGLKSLAHSYRLAAVLVVLAISGGFFTFNASASSQPGDLLYTLKLGLERAGLVRSVPEDLPTQAPSQDGVEVIITRQGDGFIESFPELDLRLLTVDPVGVELETDKDLKEIEKEEEKDLKEAEKDQKEAEKEADKILKDEEKDLEKTDKEKDKIK